MYNSDIADVTVAPSSKKQKTAQPVDEDDEPEGEDDEDVDPEELDDDEQASADEDGVSIPS